MILGLLHDSATYLSGFGYLVLYNLLFVSLSFLSYLSRHIKNSWKKWTRGGKRKPKR